jgi:ADP-ribose pyrophosphatase YjhB (NUDIX family)
MIVKCDDEWGIPGGHPEKNEEIVETLKREVLEEACVKIRNEKFFGYLKVKQEDGEEYCQLRFVAGIEKTYSMKEDPATNCLFERKFVLPNEFTKYVDWGKIGEETIKTAVKTWNNER